MKFFTAFLFFFYGIVSVSAQGSESYQLVDRIALGIPASQTNTTEDIAAYINKHFNTDVEKIRAAYTWVTTNIKYDRDSIHRVILEEDQHEKVTFALRRKKGICENFAAIFNDICVKAGIKSFIIEGYTKQGGLPDRTSHVWCGALIGNQWLLYDPTWDAGFINDGNFMSNRSTNYFAQLPEDFIQSHMPFDPLFQFLNYPVSYKEFASGRTGINNRKPYFNYADSISAYEKMDSLTRYLSAYKRIHSNADNFAVSDTKLKQLKLEAELIYQDQDMNLYNEAVAGYNAAIILYNNYLSYRNNQFQPAKPDEEVSTIFTKISNLIAAANLKLQQVNHSKATLTLDTGDIQKKLSDLNNHLSEEQSFYKNYFAGVKKN